MTYDETLTRFWLDIAYCPNMSARIVLVSRLANVRFGRPTKDRTDALRARMGSVKRFRPIECVVCWGRPHHRHHLIQLQHGGDNDTRNIVDVCQMCHAMIHPWLSVKTLAKPRKPRMRRPKVKQQPWENPPRYRFGPPNVSRDMRPRLVR